MLRHTIFLVFVSFVLLISTCDASAKPQKASSAGYTAKSAKITKSAAISSKKTAKTLKKSGISGNTKKSIKKQEFRKSAKNKPSRARVSHSRRYKKSNRNPATFPVVHKEFAGTADSALTALSVLPADGDISSSFGMRRLSKKAKRVRMHTGVDITGERGRPVFAAAAGVVCFSGRWGAYGKVVEIDHGNGLVTRYAHLDDYIVEEGAKVAPGEAVGAMGRSGRTTGSHLHFETLVNGRAVNPLIAEIWRQSPEQLAAERAVYVSGLRSASRRAY